MRSWRYYRNLLLYYASLALLIAAAARALRQPVYWVATGLLLVVHQAVRKAFASAHPWRRINPAEKDQHGFKELKYRSSDGLTLFGRFAPSRNQATILLAHGLGGSGKDLLLLARLLMRAGYGVFLPDLRAHGNSQGDTSSAGAKEGPDIACALEYLLKRIDVNGEKIGAYGISLGAQAVLRAALETSTIKALVLEDLGPARLSDHGSKPTGIKRWISLPGDWLYYVIYGLMAGARQKGTRDVIRQIGARPLYFIASSPAAAYFSRLFYESATEPRQLWELPGEAHGGAIVQDPNQYMERMLSFYSRSLGVQGGVR